MGTITGLGGLKFEMNMQRSTICAVSSHLRFVYCVAFGLAFIDIAGMRWEGEYHVALNNVAAAVVVCETLLHLVAAV